MQRQEKARVWDKIYNRLTGSPGYQTHDFALTLAPTPAAPDLGWPLPMASEGVAGDVSYAEGNSRLGRRPAVDTRLIQRCVWIIIALAVLLRVAAAFYLSDQVEALPGTYDQLSYNALALRVVTGHGFTFATDAWPATRAGEPTAHWSFLYTLYLAGVYGLAGHHPLAARLIQAVAVSLLMPWFAYRLGRRLFAPFAGVAAALIMAVYAYFVYYAAALMTESFYVIAILWALDVALRIGQSAKRPIGKWMYREWVELGVALGVATLLRQVILLFVPFLFAWLWWKAKRPEGPKESNGPEESDFPSGTYATSGTSRTHVIGPRSSFVAGLLTTTILIAALIVPWTVRNYLAFGQFVLLNTNSGYAFFWANHPIHGTHFIDLLPASGSSYQDLIPPELRSLDEAALDRALLERGLGFARDDPVRFLLLSLSRIPDYFQFWPSLSSDLISNLARALSFGLFLPFMAWGLVLARHRWRASLPLYLFVAVYSLVHILSWTGPRYRLPVDAVLIVFAGLAVVTLVERVAARWPRFVRLAGRLGRGIGLG